MPDFAEAWSKFAEVSFFPSLQYKGKKKKGDLEGGRLEKKKKKTSLKSFLNEIFLRRRRRRRRSKTNFPVS